MIFTQYYLDCLSQASYLIGDETSGRAVVVDPRRDVGEYLADAEAQGLAIELVVETHFHADFLSGHLELAAATGAEVGYSSVANPEFSFRPLGDGQRLELGEVVLEFRHTPGHTPESMCIVVWEHSDDAEPHAVLTGDTLFIGDVGRPDLLASAGHSQADLASSLFDSLHTQLLTLPDGTRLFPGHGAGSACGKNLSTETMSTIGDQRRSNYAVLAPDRATFIDLVTEGQPVAPGYFAHDVELNRSSHDLLDETEEPAALTLGQVEDVVAEGAAIVDVRDPEEFARGHLSGSINVGLNGRYAEFAGSVLPVGVQMALVADPGTQLEAKNRLARIGFDDVVGYLVDPYAVMAAHPDRTVKASRLTAAALAGRIADIEGLQIVDVRNHAECEGGSIPDSIRIPVASVRDRIHELSADRPTVVYCAGGYRSSVVASLLRSLGFGDVSDLVGGYPAWGGSVQQAG
ncbi:MAG: MBL fold metallo-hydrolase [Actinobacteria bacterium]|nr:MBL fold metallo-hydrolase [Actinomycetota bacterium]